MRQRLNDGDLVDHHEAIDAGHVHAPIECTVHDREESKEEQRDGERADGEHGAHLFARKIRKDQRKEFHARLPTRDAFDQHALVQGASVAFARSAAMGRA